MKARTILFTVVLFVFLFAGFADVATLVRAEDEAVTHTDFVAQGTAWVPERKGRFQRWRPLGWGTQVKVRGAWAPSNQWVHIDIPIATYINGVQQKVWYVQFCAKSSAGVRTKPIRLDLWDDDVKIAQKTFLWPPNNNYICADYEFTGTAVKFRESIGLSVLLHFENKADIITLGKAWVRTKP